MIDHHVRATLADANPANGLALRHAMTRYAEDQAIASRLVELRVLLQMFGGRQNALKPKQIVELRSYHNILLEDLVSRLRCGALVARGSVAASIELQEVPAGWWRDVQIDTDANAATARGTTVTGILVFDTISPADAVSTTPPGASQAAIPAKASAARGGGAVKEGFLAWGKQLGHRPTRREADRWAIGRGASTTVVRELHARHYPAAPGRPRKPRACENGRQ